jgi:hypothetical protein
MNVLSAPRTRTKRNFVSGGIASAEAVAALFTAGPAHAEENDPCANARYLDEEASLYYDWAEGYVALARTTSRSGFRDLAGDYWANAEGWFDFGDDVIADYYGC